MCIRDRLHVIEELRKEDTPVSRNIADHIDSFTDYDFAHLLFSDGTVENLSLIHISIDEVRAENGCLRLMKNLVWEYDALPHALIAGGTGGGKTY